MNNANKKLSSGVAELRSCLISSVQAVIQPNLKVKRGRIYFIK